MKKISLLAVLVCGFCAFESEAQTATQVGNGSTLKATSTAEWSKTKNNTWPGAIDGKTIWYKMNSGKVLMWSPDGKKWDRDSDGIWGDKDGSFYKIDGGNPVASHDAGVTWDSHPVWEWQATDERWYKLDKDGSVWVRK